MKYHLRVITKQRKMFRSKHEHSEEDIATLQRQHSVGLACYTVPCKDGSLALIPADNVAYYEFIPVKDKVQA